MLSIDALLDISQNASLHRPDNSNQTSRPPATTLKVNHSTNTPPLPCVQSTSTDIGREDSVSSAGRQVRTALRRGGWNPGTCIAQPQGTGTDLKEDDLPWTRSSGLSTRVSKRYSDRLLWTVLQLQGLPAGLTTALMLLMQVEGCEARLFPGYLPYTHLCVGDQISKLLGSAQRARTYALLSIISHLNLSF